MTPDIRAIPARLIPETWDQIAHGIEQVRVKAGIDDPDCIYQRLCKAEAFLFLVPDGFFILLPVQRDEPSVLVWVAYGTGGGLIHKYLPDIEALARQIGAQRIEIQSPRPGYRRVFRDWDRIGNRYIRRLP